MTLTPDFINSIFEGLAAIFILNHCRALYKAKASEGVSILSTGFFFIWGLWNIRYYPSLGQNYSFVAGIFVAIANAIWIGLMIYYRGSANKTEAVQSPTEHPQRPPCNPFNNPIGSKDLECL